MAPTPLNPEARIQEEAERLAAAWEADERWQGIRRPYAAEEVVRLRGSLPRRAHARADRGRAALAAADDGGLRRRARRAHGRPGGADGQGRALGDLPLGLAGRGRREPRRPDVSRPEPLPVEQRAGARAPAEQRAAPRRPDRVVGGRRQRRLARADRRRRRGGLRRPAERVRADEVDDRGRAPPASTSRTSSRPRRSAATWAARCSCRRRSSCARSSPRGSRPTCSACRPSSSRAPTRSARRCSRATSTRATPSS